MMSRKHYKAIAKIFKRRLHIDRDSSRLLDDLADYFAADNPNFDRERFRTACGF